MFNATQYSKFPNFKPGFHIVVSVVSVVSVVRKKFIGQIHLYGNLPYKCSMQKKRQIQLVARDRMNSICPMNFFRTTDTTDTTDTTIWKPGFAFRVFGTVQNKVSAEIAFSISGLRVRIIAQKCSLFLLKLSLGIRVSMKELSILTSKCGYLIAVIKQMSPADNFNSFRLHACFNVNDLNLSLKVR